MSRYAGVPCFWLEPTGRVRLSLRRFTFAGRGRDCPARSYGHGASVELDVELPLRIHTDEDGFRYIEQVPKRQCPGRRDPRWPKLCAQCGEPFLPGDEWQVNQAEIYTRSDNGALIAFRGHGDKAAAGALFHCWWLEGAMGGVREAKPGPDGIILTAICPNGCEWIVDGEATGGGHWTRTGDARQPETLTVTPSIIAGDYHGFLQNGRFTDDLGS
jgi:hypothetical protein